MSDKNVWVVVDPAGSNVYAAFRSIEPAERLLESLRSFGDCSSLQMVPLDPEINPPENQKAFQVKIDSRDNYVLCRECAPYHVHAIGSKPVKNGAWFFINVFAASHGAAVDKAEELLSRLP